MSVQVVILLMCPAFLLIAAEERGTAYQQNEQELADLRLALKEDYTAGAKSADRTGKESEQGSSEDQANHKQEPAGSRERLHDEESDAVEESDLDWDSDRLDLDDILAAVEVKGKGSSASAQRWRRCYYWKNAYYKQKRSTSYYYKLYRSYYSNYLRYYRLYKNYKRYYTAYYKKHSVCQNKYTTLRNGYMNTLATYRNIIKTCKNQG